MTQSKQEVSAPVTLDEPIRRGEETIDKVQVRKPKAGELRGLNYLDLARMDVSAVITVLPRVTLPMITEAEAADMEPSDQLALAGELANFFVPKAERQASRTA
ncbi:phage tail assembly protein [Sphingosinicella sp. CPCC 101087]|uniref:phage tail assembly protein n=1 Tax=Sphingosinicella sp. CPCC 101087 TaxID=2497754 RepID=UPI00101C0D62|nr:phage tail assembly protein [Sphingosinicella sp. CPCC 101087]